MIEAVGLEKVYGNKVRALNGLNLSVPEGRIFALLGPNGAGKSTTVKILTTLSQPTAGHASVAGYDVVRQPFAVRKAIGCVAQKSGVDIESTGRENLTLQAQLHGVHGQDLRSRVDGLLQRFHLADAAPRVARTYSGGMQRKLDIAMALIHRPKVLFLDEPTTGLDPEARADLWNEIARLSSEGLTILLTTHYLEEADKLAARVAIVDSGSVVAEGTPETLKSELRGDSVEVELASPAEPNALEAVLQVPGTRDLQVNGMSVHMRADNGATAVPGILVALTGAGAAAVSVKVARPTLDDVYLRHTGRTMQQAEQAVAAKA